LTEEKDSKAKVENMLKEAQKEIERMKE